MCSHRPALLAGVLFLPSLEGCTATREHFAGETWRGAFEQFSEDPYQWVPAALTIAATPILLEDDQHTSAESVEDHYFGTQTSYGDEFALVLGLTPIGVALARGAFTGDPRELAVTSEATLLIAAQTQLLKLATHRQRPDHGSGHDSFPSGHTSFAFGGATLLARAWERDHDGSKLGYLTFVPAAYVGLTRLEGNRHFLSDITFGAALGILTSNLVWNAHFGDDQHPGLFGRRARTSLAPFVEPDSVGLSWTLSF